MRSSRAFLALLLFGTVALGAGETPAARAARPSTLAPERQVVAFERLAARAPSARLAVESDYRALAEAIRAFAPMTVGSYAKEGPGVVARNVVFAFGDNFEAGLKIAELRLYGVYATALVAGAQGAPLRLARRIDARGLSTFNLERVLEKPMSAYLKAIADSVDAPGAAGAPKAMGDLANLDRYVLSAGHVVADGLALYPAEPAPPAEAKGFGAAAGAAARWARRSSFDALIFRDLRSEGASGFGTTTIMSAALAGARGWRRGDLDEWTVNDVKWATTMGGGGTLNMDMTGSVESMSASAIRLAKLFDYWSRGATPPPSETSLMSLGVWRTKGERYELAGAPYYSIGEAVTDLSRFRWFLPTRISSSARNLSYNFAAVMKLGAASADSSPEAAKAAAEFSKTIAAMERHGLATFDVRSVAIDYAWNPTTGATRFSAAGDIARIARQDLAVSAGLPDFDAFAALAPESGEAFDPATLSRALAGSTLKSFTARITDQGVLERGFAFAADMQAEQAGAPPGSVDPNDLRAAAAIAIRAAGAATSTSAVMAAVADFIAEGGTLTISTRPKPAVAFAEIGQPSRDGENPIDRLRLEAKRTP